ncbi:hypothetical protein LCGC14_1250280 [marine sediment metagenome]|uniref:Uncharacterized protein n=1 Tax=marine sediment metagenome TaxID=412755 RepID=A0A0F9L703_9ZZZZ
MAKSVREVLNRALEGLPTYRATFADLNAVIGVAIRIAGAVGMVVRIKTIHVDVPAANQTPLIIGKYSTAPADGTSTSPQSVPLDSNSDAARATVLMYTVAPTLGTLVGEVFEDDIFTVDDDAYRGDRVHEEFGKGDGGESLTLRTAAENVGVVIAANSNPLNGYIEWTEEPAIADPTPNV